MTDPRIQRVTAQAQDGSPIELESLPFSNLGKSALTMMLEKHQKEASDLIKVVAEDAGIELAAWSVDTQNFAFVRVVSDAPTKPS